MDTLAEQQRKPLKTPYAELHCLSNHSFLRGASHPEELVKQAYQLGYGAIAITDECSYAGLVKAHIAAKECGIKLIVGAEFTVQLNPPTLVGTIEQKSKPTAQHRKAGTKQKQKQKQK